jgi:polyisoprenyl-teichoic acid--peptidoglycan teichoic acid transferase
MFARIPPNLLARATLMRAGAVVVALIVAVVACNLVTAPKPVALASPSPSPTATPTESPSPSPTPTLSPTPTPKPSALLSQRVTVLVLGTDSNASRLARGMGKLTDSITVLSVNAKHTQVSMISFARDTVDIPTGTGGIWSLKINSLAYYRGETAMKRAIAATIGQPINYYLEINMEDFGRLVNAIGGIDVKVPAPIYDPSIGLSIRAGRHHMDGNLALSYARSRHTTSDWDRAARQQLILAAIIRKLVDPKTKIHLTSLVQMLKTLETDMPLHDLGAFLEIARRSARAKLVGGVLAPPRFAGFTGIEPGTSRGWIQEPNLPAIRAYARSLLAG